MKISYKKLWNLLIDYNISPADLQRKSGLSCGSMTKLRKSESVSMGVLWKICVALNCNIENIVEFIF